MMHIATETTLWLHRNSTVQGCPRLHSLFHIDYPSAAPLVHSAQEIIMSMIVQEMVLQLAAPSEPDV